MSLIEVRVSIRASIPWNILARVMRFESNLVCPVLTDLTTRCQDLLIEVSPLIFQLESLGRKIDGLTKRIDAFREELTPLWDDSYNLCGDSTCTGECTVCTDGEYDGDEDSPEKYCKRGRR